MTDEIRYPDRSAILDAGWPMPSPEVRRQALVVPTWGSSRSEDAEPVSTEGGEQ